MQKILTFLKGIKNIFYWSKNPLKYIIRYFELTLYLKPLKKIIISDYLFGIRLYLDFKYDGAIFSYFLAYVDWPYKFIEYNLLQKGSVMVDIGSNIGNHALIGLSKGADVHVFEPNTKILKFFQINVLINQLNLDGFDSKNLSINNGVVSDTDKDLKFYEFDGEKTGISSINKPESGDFHEIVVKSYILDDYALQKDIKKINFLKVDAEGAEYKIFKGAQNLIKGGNIDVIFWESNLQSNQEDIKSIIKDFEDNGYVNMYFEMSTREFRNWDGDHDCLTIHKSQLNKIKNILSKI